MKPDYFSAMAGDATPWTPMPYKLMQTPEGTQVVSAPNVKPGDLVLGLDVQAGKPAWFIHPGDIGDAIDAGSIVLVDPLSTPPGPGILA